MKVFKFGGASVKDAQSVKNMINILDMYTDDQIFIVVSAMGKTTNALENIVIKCYENINYEPDITSLYKYLKDIIEQLFSKEFQESVFSKIEESFSEMKQKLYNKDNYVSYDELYDMVVPFGEILSSQIIFEYLNCCHKVCYLINAVDWVNTDNYYRSAKVNIETSTTLLKNEMDFVCNNNYQYIITQGFIGATSDGCTTTLGREGSDYTAALVGAFLHAESITVWKDVAGLFSADPKRMDNCHKIDKLSYREAIELAYYGASIIHPKTVKPLENSNIPLYIKSFIKPIESGTCICQFNDQRWHIPFFIFHDHQMLISISVKDMSFIAEESLHLIFGILSKLRIQVRLMQNSAVSFSLCIDEDDKRNKMLIALLSEHFVVLYNSDLTLITIRHYQYADMAELLVNKEVLLEQRSRSTAQFLVRDISKKI